MSKEFTPASSTDMISEYMRFEHNLSAIKMPEHTQRFIGHLLLTGRDALVTGEASDARWAELLRIAAHSSETGDPDRIITSLKTYLSEHEVSVSERTSASRA